MTATELFTRPLDGEVLVDGDPGYETARTVWNAMVDRRPQVVVRAASVDDVAAAVRVARERDLEIGVRCGGHSVVGHAVPDGGLMIDLSPMSLVRVDPAHRRAHVQGGALLGALDRAAQAYDLATTAGNVSHTGVGGLTLGGGMGWLARQHGLSCDNVASFEVVTADGSVVRATPDEHPDLYWALRGGGGNFGVVTDFEFRLHETGTQALSVELDIPRDAAPAAMRRWRDLNATAPREATFMAFVGPGLDVVTLGYVWVGDVERGRALLPEFRSIGPSAGERVAELSYLELQTREDSIEAHAVRRYWKGNYFREFPDEVVDTLLRVGEAGPFAPNVSIQAYGGAIADVGEDDSAFSHRDTAFEVIAAAGWTDAGEDDERIATARAYAATLQPYASGVYVNALVDEGAAGVARAYTEGKLERLTTVKKRYDPDNVFHLNQNIAPSR